MDKHSANNIILVLPELDNYLTNYLDIYTLSIYAQLSYTCHMIAEKNVCYQEIQKFKKNYKMPIIRTFIDWVCAKGNTKILEWLRCTGPGFKLIMDTSYMKTDIITELDHLSKKKYFYIYNAINMACEHGHLHILQWFEKNNISIEYTNYAMDKASLNGHIHILNWFFYQSQLPIQCSEKAVDGAAINGQINILDWWRKYSCDYRDTFKYTADAMDCASKNKHYQVINWFMNLHIPVKYSEKIFFYPCQNGDLQMLQLLWQIGFFRWNIARTDIFNKCIDFASEYGHTDVLDWLIVNAAHTLPDHYTTNAIDLAAGNGHINVLDWYKNSMFKFEYSEKAINYACKNGHIHVLEWFHENKYQLKYTAAAIDNAAENGHANIINWFPKYNYPLLYTSWAVDFAAASGHIDILDLFRNICSIYPNLNLNFLYTSQAMDMAARYGHIHILKWFANSGLKMCYTVEAIDMACAHGLFDVLVWFQQFTEKSVKPKYTFKYSKNAIISAYQNYDTRILDWFKNHGYKLKGIETITRWIGDIKYRYHRLRPWLEINYPEHKKYLNKFDN